MVAFGFAVPLMNAARFVFWLAVGVVITGGETLEPLSIVHARFTLFEVKPASVCEAATVIEPFAAPDSVYDHVPPLPTPAEAVPVNAPVKLRLTVAKRMPVPEMTTFPGVVEPAVGLEITGTATVDVKATFTVVVRPFRDAVMLNVVEPLPSSRAV